jgi:hypothetical protein
MIMGYESSNECRQFLCLRPAAPYAVFAYAASYALRVKEYYKAFVYDARLQGLADEAENMRGRTFA